MKFCRKLFGDRLVRGYPLILPGQVQSTLPLWSSGGSWGGPPLFLDQTDARRAEKNFFQTPFPLFVGLDLPLRTPLQDYVGSCLFQSFYHYYTPYKMDSRHFLNHQQTLDRCFMQWKIPLKEKYKCRSDSKLQNFYYCMACSSLQSINCYTFRPWSRDHLLVMNVWLHNMKIIPLSATMF